jgi:hypothetical protein
MIASYRDPRYAASIRIQQMRERFGELEEGVPDTIVVIYARRVARMWAGGTAIAGFVAVVLAAILYGLSGSGAPAVSPTFVLVDAVLLSLLVYAIALVAAGAAFRSRMSTSSDGDELARAARLEDSSIRREAAREAASSERRSLALPMAGFSLLAPLSMHLAVWCFSDHPGAGSERWLRSFDWWICASLILVGIAHLALAYLCMRFADEVEETSLAELERRSPRSGWAALGYAVLWSCLPGVVAIGIPVVLVAVTGLVFVPAMFWLMRRRVIAERVALGAR